MTDEEMAEEYAEEFYDEYRMTRGDIENAFLAGLKAGKPQWHKVADGDLPKYVVMHYVQDGYGNHRFYDNFKKVWRDIDGDICPAPKVWCEIPTFDKE